MKKVHAFLFTLLLGGALAAQAEFKAAHPVWPAGQALTRNTFYGFRASFTCPENVAPVLRITGCSVYRLTLNGRHVGWGPARAAHGYFRVDELPLPVQAGTNTLAIEVAGYNCFNYCYPNQPSFLQAEVEAGGRILAATGVAGDFTAFSLPRVQKVVRYSFQRTFTERYRVTPHTDAWKVGKVTPAAVPLEQRPAVKLLPRRIPFASFAINGPFKALSTANLQFDATRKVKPIRFVNDAGTEGVGSGFPANEIADNWWELAQRYVSVGRTPIQTPAPAALPLAGGTAILYDAGLNDTGFLMLHVRCTRPGTLAVRFDEILTDGEVSPTRYSCANTLVWDFTEPGEYTVEAFEPYTFRYAEVLACSGDFTLAAPSLRTYKNPLAKRAQLTASDPMLMRIFEAARESFAQNAADVFTDCPGRERAGWLCDSFFTGRSSMLFTGERAAEQLFLENYVLPDRFAYLPEGMFAMCYPADFTNGNFIPNWAFWLVLELEEYKNRGGDPALIAAFRPRILKLIDYIHTFRNADGLLEKLPRWVFVEWSLANRLVQDVNYPSNMTWAEVLDATHRLYNLPQLAQEAAHVRDTVRRQSWTGKWFCDNAIRQKDGTLKLSGTCTETCQYYAFFFKTATPATYPALWQTLVTDFGPERAKTGKYPEIAQSNAFIGNYLRLECLSRDRRSAQILKETRGFFAYMAERTGTLWENTTSSASCNHGFASHAAVLYVRDVLGLRAIDYRAKTVAFDPPAEIPLSEIHLQLPVGGNAYIRAGWHTAANGARIPELTLPPAWRAVPAKR